MASLLADESGSPSVRGTTSSSADAAEELGTPPRLLRLQSAADYTVDESYETPVINNHEDHTFSGIMFDIIVKDLLPVQYLELSQVWVRGALGNLTVWMTEGSHERVFDQPDRWHNIFEGTRDPSSTLVPLEIDPPLCLPAGQVIGLYVHSTRPGDQSIVYDNQRHQISHEDHFIQVTSGCAHLVPRPFDSRGNWGWGWRPKREFVGKVSYGIKYLLWKPEQTVHSRFPVSFERAITTVMCCARRAESPLSILPPEVVFFIINMCSWNWFGDAIEAVGYGANGEEQYAQESSAIGSSGIGWRSGNYRSLIHEMMSNSVTGQRLLQGHAAMDESGEDTSEDDFEEMDDEDEDHFNIQTLLNQVIENNPGSFRNADGTFNQAALMTFLSSDVFASLLASASGGTEQMDEVEEEEEGGEGGANSAPEGDD